MAFVLERAAQEVGETVFVFYHENPHIGLSLPEKHWNFIRSAEKTCKWAGSPTFFKFDAYKLHSEACKTEDLQ